ncbi:hypothetical protein E2562_030585 [Oryza meyeriana var. granulata]|uniref:Uncharacterized protein n=1 Tax=Oryza meyeriana var. granulata TaxID=110450 RepID=A0A6G1ER56_9ORYZ|nr:hypothetical protein E2562_030585 [Oryza meyeriana var. granulata]
MAEKKALKISSELFSGDSAAAEDFAKWSKIEEVHVKSDESQNLLRMVSSDGCLNCELHTDDEELIEEVIIFEIERGKPEAIASSDGLPERHHVQDLSIDWFEKEINSRDAIKSGTIIANVAKNCLMIRRHKPQEIKKVAVSDASKPPEVLFLNGKQIDSRSGELSGFPNENGTSGLRFPWPELS